MACTAVYAEHIPPYVSLSERDFAVSKFELQMVQTFGLLESGANCHHIYKEKELC